MHSKGQATTPVFRSSVLQSHFLGLSKLIAANPLAPECGRYVYVRNDPVNAVDPECLSVYVEGGRNYGKYPMGYRPKRIKADKRKKKSWYYMVNDPNYPLAQSFDPIEAACMVKCMVGKGINMAPMEMMSTAIDVPIASSGVGIGAKAATGAFIRTSTTVAVYGAYVECICEYTK